MRLGGARENPAPEREMYRSTRSNSSFFLIAYELDDSFAQFMISSARHSAMDLMLPAFAAQCFGHRSRAFCAQSSQANDPSKRGTLPS